MSTRHGARAHPRARGLDVIVDTPPVPMSDSGPPRDYVD